MSDPNDKKRDLVLPVGSFAYMQDTTKGVIKVYTGPTVINPTAQEVPVIFDAATGRFDRATLENAQQVAPLAAEGFYLTLKNPAKDNRHPAEGTTASADELQMGRTIIVPGPAQFALWPGQSAQVVEGHHLRSNQYLLVRVYNEDQARKNWAQAVIKLATQDGEVAPTVTSNAAPVDLTVGKQIIIRGTEVSFYIPPTGIEVAANDDGTYARDALTLERLEYAILVDENGKKRYEVGPQVVFPAPSERFVEAKDDRGQLSRKFRAIELNEIQGIHIKVIAPYTEGGRSYKAGEELFITGKDTQIYFPREEHSALKYDGKAKHFATAIPAGEARYMLNRLTGEIRTVKGPAMLLPDPRTEVIVRRVLTDKQCMLWYPDNAEALEYNRGLRTILQNVPTTRSGAVSEGDVARGAKSVGATRGAGLASSVLGQSAVYAASNVVMDSSRQSGDQGLVGDEFSRSATYTQPRTVTLETKYQGAPSIDIWTGYAVLVVSKTGKRRVEQGPTTVLLEYDESLEALELSTGKPKTTEKLLRVPYLRVEHNKVTDVLNLETADHVMVQVYLSYLVNFEGEAEKWFGVENYVKFLCDHTRSILKGQVHKLRVEDFYANATDLIRNILLGAYTKDGEPRHGLVFPQNGMRVADVEVLKVMLADDKIRPLLDAAQHDAVRSNIEVANLRRQLTVTKEREALAQEDNAVKTATVKAQHGLQLELLASELAVALMRITNTVRTLEEERTAKLALSKTEDALHEAKIVRISREKTVEQSFASIDQAAEIAMLQAEAASIVTRFNAASPGFSEALLSLSRNETLVKVAQAWEVQRTIAGESLADTLGRLFNGTPLKPLVEKLLAASPNGKHPPTA